MYNVLIAFDSTTWESGQRMGMAADRFLEHSGDECAHISLTNHASLKELESIQTLLLYEKQSDGETADIIRIGKMRDILVNDDRITFRFAENGRIPYGKFDELKDALQIGRFEINRTHWAVKDGEIPQEVLMEVVATPKRYDVVLSFAGEDREYVEDVASYLESKGVDVFYDRYEEVTLWGKDLVEHLDSVYRKQGRYCIMFISKHYAKKIWTTHERRSAFARALEERVEYILPARFDNTDIPGLRPTVGYVDLQRLKPPALGQLIMKKLGRA
jgi:hypothetical protein